MGSSEQEQEQEPDLRARLRAMFVPGSRLERDCAVVEVRDTTSEVVLMLRWKRDPRLYGIPIALDDTTRDFYYTDFPVASTDEWLDSVGVGMGIHLGTGFRARARRSQVDDYIELRAAGGWPDDDRFYMSVVGPHDGDSWLRVPFVEEAGLDPAVAVASRDQGRLIGWVTAYENNATGQPYVGHAVVSWTGETTASLEYVEVTAGLPVTVVVDLASLAAHVAGEAGALSVTTDLDLDDLELAGFRYDANGVRAADTSFLDEDPAGAEALLREVLTSPGRWGQNRDAAGRYLPPTRMGRLWHRLRHGPSGAPPRMYAG